MLCCRLLFDMFDMFVGGRRYGGSMCVYIIVCGNDDDRWEMMMNGYTVREMCDDAMDHTLNVNSKTQTQKLTERIRSVSSASNLGLRRTNRDELLVMITSALL